MGHSSKRLVPGLASPYVLSLLVQLHLKTTPVSSVTRATGASSWTLNAHKTAMLKAVAPCRWQCRWDQGQATRVVHPRPISSTCPQVAGCTPPWTPRRQAPARSGATAPKQVCQSLETLHGLMEGAFWAMSLEQKLFVLAQGEYSFGHALSRLMAVP